MVVFLVAFAPPVEASDAHHQEAPPSDSLWVDGAPVTPPQAVLPPVPPSLLSTSPGHIPLDTFGLIRGAVSATSSKMMLTGTDFYPITSEMTYTSAVGGLYATALDPGYGFSASYHPSSGTIVTAITFYYFDFSTENIRLGAYAFDPAANLSNMLAVDFTSDSSANIRQIDLTGAGLPIIIDNSTYAYRLGVEFADSGTSVQSLYGAQI